MSEVFDWIYSLLRNDGKKSKLMAVFRNGDGGMTQAVILSYDAKWIEIDDQHIWNKKPLAGILLSSH